MSPAMPEPRRIARRAVLALPVAAWAQGFAAGRAAAGGPETLAELRGAEVPAGPLVVAIARVTLPPGGDVPASIPAGARMVFAERESVLLRRGVDHAGPFGGAAALGGEPLRQGWGVAMPALAVAGIGNAGTRAATVLDAAVYPADTAPPPGIVTGDGVEFALLAGFRAEAVAPGRLDVVLRRIDLARGEAIPHGMTTGVALLCVDAGRCALRLASGEGVVAIAAGGIGPASASRPASREREEGLPAGSSAFLPLGAAARVTGDADRTRAFLLTLHPSRGQPRAEGPPLAARGGFPPLGEWADGDD